MKKITWNLLFAVIFVLQLAVAFFFCEKKQGYHYDEYYSYYSSNKTYGLYPSDREWKDTDQIISEFMVEEGQGFSYGLVKAMQSFDVHPPLYYMILHTICSLFPGSFSKWMGLSLNLFFFGICYLLLLKISHHIFDKNQKMVLFTGLLFGFQSGVLSGILFIRMYMLLTVWCMAIILWHSNFWKEKLHMGIKNSIILMALVFLGFLTHYYFAVFLFFVCAFTCLYEWWGRKNLKQSILYGTVVCFALGLAVLYYPASLRHIFRGYRGTEATGAFFDLSNTKLRLEFFLQLMNDSVFGGGFWILLLLLLLLIVTVGLKPEKKWFSAFVKEHLGYCHIFAASAGYFIVVAKTALLNAEEANRYELPVYGFIMMILLGAFYFPSNRFWNLLERKRKEQEENSDCCENVRKKEVWEKKNVMGLTAAAGIIFLLAFQWSSLQNGGVQFLYEEDEKNVSWAAGQKDKTIVYCYNPVNEWMIWDESEELMQYEKIYFINLLNEEPVEDKLLLEADEIYLYSSRMDQAQQIMNQLLENNPKIQTKEKIRELLYCDLYRLY